MSQLPLPPASRQLGDGGPNISPIAWGMWRLAEGGRTAAEAAKLVHAVLDAGITLLDTADIYGFDGTQGFGDAEALLGEVLAAEAGLRGRMVLSTKGGILPPLPYDQSAGYLAEAIDASLRRLRTDHVDLWQVHRPDILAHPQEVARLLDDAVQAGKIRALGVSNFTTSQTAALQQFLDHKLVATQPEISPLHIACFEDGTLDQAMMLGLVPLGWPPQLARRIATLDRILGANPSGGGGRLNINIISSDLPGEKLESAARYGRTTEVIKILRTLLSGDHLDHQGEFYRMKLDPPRMTTLSGKPPAFYFGGLSEDARECAAEGCDVYLMWPDTMPNVREIIADMTARAARFGRKLKFGYRAHVIVRDTEEEARAYADRLLSKLDDEVGRTIREKSLDAKTAGVQRQAELRNAAGGDGFVEDNLWTGIGRARSGCGAAIVGNPDQVLAKLRAYQAEGIEAFILSGYPHTAEADLFSRHVLPHIEHGPLAV